MRILQVNSAVALGGGETHVLELTEGLRKLGHEVFVAGRTGSRLNPDITLPFLNSADFMSALKLRTIMRRENIQVVHGHVARDYPVIAAAAWRLNNVTVVLTRHLLYPVKRHILYRRVDGWLAPTRRILKTLSPLRPKCAAVISNWVDTRKIAYRPQPLHQPVTIGILGQIAAHKGHDDLVEAIRVLGPAFRMLAGGTGEAEYVSALRQLATGLPVEFVGFTQAADFLSRVDMLAVPSWEEPFGIVLLEAMAAGVPVVATARGGPLDIIRAGEDGLLVEPRNPNSLAHAIREIAGSSELREKLVRQARVRVEEEFAMERLIPRVADFYRVVSGSGGPAGPPLAAPRFQ
jgi:glycosyltransferase involved in cell wall biosynthesis